MPYNIPADPDPGYFLSGGNAERLEEIRAIWYSRAGLSPHDLELIHLALTRLERDLRSERRGEVIEEIRREVDYREWCDRVTAESNIPAEEKK